MELWQSDEGGVIKLKSRTKNTVEIIFTEIYFLNSRNMKKELNKETILKSVTKMITDKEAVRSYIKGKSSIQSIKIKGIKFAKPL